MAIPTAVNGQITDAVTQANTTVLGDAPAVALASLYQVSSHSVGLMLQNAVAQQQNSTTIANAVVANCANLLLSSKA